ncbi:MAG TPA: GMC family oxidoreductase N-terminal domain-containing protein [Solirubrobacteraceae bacterium]|nr:GMC family oxidoreductase N-terminal domain-containing protein [Solirubrobacteraceae bacterium]
MSGDTRNRARIVGAGRSLSIDFLIVGAGSAGCVLANRLSAAGARVLLLEAGRDTPPAHVPADISDTYPRSYYNPSYMWPGLTASLTAGSAPAEFPQARVMGGGSSLTGLVALRGMPDDYDEWERLGADGWGWPGVVPYFRRLESDADCGDPECADSRKCDGGRGDGGRGDGGCGDGAHGSDGPVAVSRVPRDQWPPFARAIGEATQHAGFAVVDDFNGDVRDGYGPLPLTRSAGGRVSSASAYLDAESRARPNLTIECETTVTRLLFRGSRCVGVRARCGGDEVDVWADRTVVCAGAIHSPALLMRSGIGDPGALAAERIDVVADAREVGRHLFNHPVLYLATHLRPQARQGSEVRAQFVSALRFSSGATPDAPGDLLGSDSGGAADGAGDMVMLVVNKSSWHRLGDAVAGLGVGCYRPLSRGTVELRPGDAAAEPRVSFELLSEPSDRQRMARGLALALQLMRDDDVRAVRHELFTAAYSETVRRLNRPGRFNALRTGLLAAALDSAGPVRHGLIRHGIAGGEVDEAAMGDDAWLSDTVGRRTFGMYHPAGTCRMGSDEGAVVDGRCAVRGVDGLSVVDGSVMPAPVRGATNLPVMMIAERAADLILERARPS